MRIFIRESDEADKATKKRARRIMTDTEKKLKKDLIDALVNKSNSFGTDHHAKYAKYLRDNFDVEKVTKKADPNANITAYIDPENAVIAIG